jgi:hypothetical protein
MVRFLSFGSADSTSIFTSSDSQTISPSALRTCAFIEFSQFSSQSISFSNIPLLSVVVLNVSFPLRMI